MKTEYEHVRFNRSGDGKGYYGKRKIDKSDPSIRYHETSLCWIPDDLTEEIQLNNVAIAELRDILSFIEQLEYQSTGHPAA